MKFVILAVTALVIVLGGSAVLAHSSSSSKTTIVTLPSSQPNSNVSSTNNSLASASKTIIKAAVNKDRVLYLNNEIDFNSVRQLSSRLKELNAKSSDDIFLMIDSPGGSVLDGATLESEIEASKAHVNTVCTRLCASMAAMIHSYGYKRYGTDRSILMYHPASGGAQGQVPNMLSQLSTINRYISKQVSHLVGRSKMSQEEFDKLVAYELWIDAEDAVTKGLNDGIINLNVPNTPENQQTTLSPPREQKGGKGFQWISPNLYLWER